MGKMHSVVFLSVAFIAIQPISCAYEHAMHKESGKVLNMVDDDDKVHQGHAKMKENMVAKSVMKEPLYLTSISFINGSYQPVRFARPGDVQAPAPIMEGESMKRERTFLQASYGLEDAAAEAKEDSYDSDADVVLDLNPPATATPKKGKQAFYRLATYFLNGTKTEEKVPLEDTSDDYGQ